jgi:hypothetical protein
MAEVLSALKIARSSALALLSLPYGRHPSASGGAQSFPERSWRRESTPFGARRSASGTCSPTGP